MRIIKNVKIWTLKDETETLLTHRILKSDEILNADWLLPMHPKSYNVGLYWQRPPLCRVRILETNIYRLKSCGRPAAYTKKYIAREELVIILSFILQTFNLKMEKYGTNLKEYEVIMKKYLVTKPNNGDQVSCLADSPVA